LAIDSKLRGCDIVKIKIGDIAAGGVIGNRATVMQQKTKRPVQFEIMTEARQTLLKWLNRRGGSHDDFIFPSRVNYMGHLSTRQYARLVDEWVGAVGLNVHEYGTHSMRRTKASLIYKATGNLRAIQILLGHSNIENTVRYLGVDVDDAIALAEWSIHSGFFPLSALSVLIDILSDPCKLSRGWSDQSRLADEQQQRTRSSRQLHCLTHTFQVCDDNAFVG
jgi:integrase